MLERIALTIVLFVNTIRWPHSFAFFLHGWFCVLIAIFKVFCIFLFGLYCSF